LVTAAGGAAAAAAQAPALVGTWRLVTYGGSMAKVTYDKEVTALLVIDPYNDFISEGGKVWDCLRAVAEANRCVPHMLQGLNAVRKAGFRVFYALHHRYRVIGLIAHTCVESTVRFAAELGYEVTVVKDATASYSDEEMHAALDVNIPNYARAMVTTHAIVDSLSSL
jgi:nicotinamidase-related amidase